MKAMELNWGKFLPRALVLGAIIAAGVFVAVHAAMAREGERGGHTRTFLTVAGSIAVPVRMPPMTPHLTFIFEKVDPLSDAGAAAGPSVVCTVTNASTQYNTSTGSFSSEIPIDACPGSMFDGANVWVTTVVRDGSMTGAELLRTERRPLNPVPYARYADQYGTPDCPVGYERVTDGFFTLSGTGSDRRLCNRRLADARMADEVVRVGSGPSAFWIDRFEDSVSGSPDGSGPRYGATTDDYGAGFPANGEWTERRYALSVQLPTAAGNANAPARNITWFQASAACRLAGKRLPTGDEWLLAAHGTPDPSDCRISPAAGVREAGNSALCKSYWGAHDMIGNLWEWTSEWTSPGNLLSATSGFADGGVGWPAGFNSDQSENFPGQALVAGSTYRSGVPAAIVRGGSLNGGGEAGVFAISAIQSPALAGPSIGFRCVIPR